MACSPEQLAANRRNSLKSTGPRSPEGKARCRGNATKHGLTGAGLALPVEDQAQVEDRFKSLGEDLALADERDRLLGQRVALLSLRLDRCARYEAAALTELIRTAQDDYDDERRRQVEDAIKRLPEEPMTSVRRLARSPEGLDWMIGAWEELGRDLSQLGHWQFTHVVRGEQLLGRRKDEPCSSRINALAAAMNGDFRLMDPVGVKYPTDPMILQARKQAAKDDLLALIHGEVDKLRALRAALPWEDLARSRAEAPLRRLFDPSHEAILLRRYETAAAREMHKILEQFDRPAAEPEPEKPASTEAAPTTCEELAPFRNPEESDPIAQQTPAVEDPPSAEDTPGATDRVRDPGGERANSGPTVRIEGPAAPLDAARVAVSAGDRHVSDSTPACDRGRSGGAIDPESARG
jgi:hypothetical protein